VLVFSLLFCHEAGLDPVQVVRGKLRQNAKKYPLHLAKGRALKYTELQSPTEVRASEGEPKEARSASRSGKASTRSLADEKPT
jgi:hypothetical protein